MPGSSRHTPCAVLMKRPNGTRSVPTTCERTWGSFWYLVFCPQPSPLPQGGVETRGRIGFHGEDHGRRSAPRGGGGEKGRPPGLGAHTARFQGWLQLYRAERRLLFWEHPDYCGRQPAQL